MAKRFHFSIARTQNDVGRAIASVLDGIRFRDRSSKNVFLKPNFTYPFFKEGVTTTRVVIVAIIQYLRECGCTRICLGEGEGGYNSFSMDRTFRSYRLEELAKSLGLEVVNISRVPSRTLEIRGRRGRFSVRVPRMIFEEFDTFITIPVPKVHAMATISNAVKNQWGILQDNFRVAFHVAFDEIICEICCQLPNPIAVVDGIHGLTRNGPMIEGEAIELGWVSACDDLFLNDSLICQLMQIPMERVQHLMYAKQLGLIPNRAECEVDGKFAQFVDERFYLKRHFWNRLAKLTWYSKKLNHFVYFSDASTMLHKLMYSIRKNPADLCTRGRDWQ